jgi:spore coat polysaccharide biosynthesis protein SpsF
MKTLGVVHIEHSPSSKPPAAFRRLAGKPLIEWVVRRVSESMQLDSLVVALSGASDEDRGVGKLIPADVPILSMTTRRGAGLQFAEMASNLGADAILRISVRNPFIDSALIDRLVTAAENRAGCDYASYCQRDGTPAALSPLGVNAEWLSVAALRRVEAEIHHDDFAAVTHFILTNAKQYNVQQIRLPDELDQADLRFTVDSAEDLERTQELYEALGPERLEWQRLAEFLKQQPRLRQRMAALNHQLQHPHLPAIDHEWLDAKG